MSGKRQISGLNYVLDEFHLQKIPRLFWKKEKETEETLIKRICHGTKKTFEERIKELKKKAILPV